MNIRRVLYSHSNKRSFRNDKAFDLKEQRRERDKQLKKDNISGQTNSNIADALASDILNTSDKAKKSEGYRVEKYGWTQKTMDGLIQQKQYGTVLKNINKFKNIDTTKVTKELCLKRLEDGKKSNDTDEKMFIDTMMRLGFSPSSFAGLDTEKVINAYIDRNLEKYKNHVIEISRGPSHPANGDYPLSPKEEMVEGLSSYIPFTVQTAKIFLKKGYEIAVHNNLPRFDREGQKYIIEYFVNKKRNLNEKANIIKRSGVDDELKAEIVSSVLIVPRLKGLIDSWLRTKDKWSKHLQSSQLYIEIRNFIWDARGDGRLPINMAMITKRLEELGYKDIGDKLEG